LTVLSGFPLRLFGLSIGVLIVTSRRFRFAIVALPSR